MSRRKMYYKCIGRQWVTYAMQSNKMKRKWPITNTVEYKSKPNLGGHASHDRILPARPYSDLLWKFFCRSPNCAAVKVAEAGLRAMQKPSGLQHHQGQSTAEALFCKSSTSLQKQHQSADVALVCRTSTALVWVHPQRRLTRCNGPPHHSLQNTLHNRRQQLLSAFSMQIFPSQSEKGKN